MGSDYWKASREEVVYRLESTIERAEKAETRVRELEAALRGLVNSIESYQPLPRISDRARAARALLDEGEPNG